MKCKIPTSDVLYRPNLLVNGDFLINQRGQSEYNFSTNGVYGLDCWQHRQGNYTGALIVKPIKSGGVHIKLGASSGGGLRQVLNADDFKIGQPYTAVVSINNTRYKGTLNLSNVAQKYIENDLFQLEIGIIDGNFNYSLWIKKQGFEGDINYCDLFPGSIAYEHQKEDKATAFDRCTRKLNVFKEETSTLGFAVINGNHAYGLITCNKMDDKILSAFANGIFQILIDGVDVVNIKLVNIRSTSTAGLSIDFTLEKDMSQYNGRVGRIYLQNGNFVVSCEPLS